MPIEQKDPNTGASSFIPTEDEKKQLELMKKIYSSTVDLDELKNQMKSQEQATQLLQHGANIVDATAPSNLGIEIQGRTLVNYSSGVTSTWKGSNITSVTDDTTTVKYVKSYKAITSATANTGNAYIAFDVLAPLSASKKYVIRADVKASASTTLFTSPRYNGDIFKQDEWVVGTDFQPLFIKITGKEAPQFTFLIESYTPNLTFWVDTYLGVYEVPDEVYNGLYVDAKYSGENIDNLLPYVKGVQHLNPVVVSEGGNLIPPFTDSSWSIHANAKVDSLYDLSLTATANYQNSSATIKSIKGATYTFSVDDIVGKGCSLYIKVDNLYYTLADTTKQITFTASQNASSMTVSFTNNASSGVFTVKNPMLVLGDKPKPFVPRNPSYLYTNTKLAGFNGVNDFMYKDNGTWKVRRNYALDVTLDGTRNWTYNASKTGLKTARLTGTFGFNITNPYRDRLVATRWDDKVVPGGNITTLTTEVWDLTSADIFNINIMNSDTGFTDAYTPVNDEIKSFFNGWKVKTVDGSGKPTAWISVINGVDAPTQTLSYVKDNRAPNYSPYKITYQLATPRVETVQVEGDIAVNGLTQVTVDSGVMVREKVKPILLGGNYFINNSSDSSRLQYQASNVLNVFKNGIKDLKWVTGTSSSAFGKVRANIPQQDFDPTAEYTVIYSVLDKHLFTTNAVDVKSSYTQSVRSSIDGLNTRQTQSTTDISILQGITVDILARLKANNL